MEIDITPEQARDLATLLSVLTGTLQYEAISNPNADDGWHRWHPVAEAVSRAIGFQAVRFHERLKWINVTLNYPKAAP